MTMHNGWRPANKPGTSSVNHSNDNVRNFLGMIIECVTTLPPPMNKRDKPRFQKTARGKSATEHHENQEHLSVEGGS